MDVSLWSTEAGGVSTLNLASFLSVIESALLGTLPADKREPARGGLVVQSRRALIRYAVFHLKGLGSAAPCSELKVDQQGQRD